MFNSFPTVPALSLCVHEQFCNICSLDKMNEKQRLFLLFLATNFTMFNKRVRGEALLTKREITHTLVLWFTLSVSQPNGIPISRIQKVSEIGGGGNLCCYCALVLCSD